MKTFNWNTEKNQQLITERKISFEQIVQCIEEGRLLDIVAHHNPDSYSNQQILIVEYQGYCDLVPFVESETEYFLKTIIPSIKLTKAYIIKEDKK
ncbi:MAG TPA: toxin [Candidatus Margulisbacteria bacterium]|nr:MAG: toxin [Candidatus Margulisbacteria bacterium GWD2_39_127]HAR64340.1 toxin [Candidatus Margulisiibacteriota bacterium]